MEKDKIQSTLDVLVELHDDQSALDEITSLGGLQHPNVVQSSIAGTVRYLMQIRDEN